MQASKIGVLTSITLSDTFVLNLKLERLCLAKKTLKDCGSSTTEFEPKGVSINSFCISNNIPYTAFYDWFRNTSPKKNFAYNKQYSDRKNNRSITVKRHNNLFLGSVKEMQNTAIYNTFIETCKQAGVFFRDYFCKLLRELKKGKTD